MLKQTQYFISGIYNEDQYKDALWEVTGNCSDFIMDNCDTFQEIVSQDLFFTIIPSHHPTNKNRLFATITLSFYNKEV